MANFIPPANGASQGNYFPPKMRFQPKTPKFKEKGHKLAVFEAKTGLQKQLWQPNLQTFFIWFLVLVR